MRIGPDMTGFAFEKAAAIDRSRGRAFRDGLTVRALKTIAFVYKAREDRILAAINFGKAEAWSCWLTRRLVGLLLGRVPGLLATTSPLSQRAPADVRGELSAFEREAAIAKTAKAMSHTPAEVEEASGAVIELVERMTISGRGDNFRVELRGESGSGAAASVTRAELQRILQMLQAEVAKSEWLAPLAKSPAAPANEAAQPKPARH